MLSAIGDSRTVGPNNVGPLEWQADMRNALNVATSGTASWVLGTPIAQGGQGANWLSTTIDAQLAAYVGTPDAFLVNIGINDVGGMSLATWEADMLYALNAILTKFPSTKVLFSRFWGRSADPTLRDQLDDTGIPYLIAAHPANCSLADDERVWLENGDNGVTYTTDGVHYNEAGEQKKAALMVPLVRAALGY